MVSVCPPFFKLRSQVVDGKDELRLARSSLAGAMLGVGRDVVTVEVRCYCYTDNVFKELSADWCWENGSIVCYSYLSH